jgi:adenylate cyclase class 2
MGYSRRPFVRSNGNMGWEVEQKYRVANLAIVRERLVALGATLGETIEQADRYFNHPSRDFRLTDEALRVRRSGGAMFITYKGPRIDGETKTRQEIELPLPNQPSTLDEFTQLFEALGFRRVATVSKCRQPTHLQWQGCSVQVALDDVPGVGSFVELEIAADDAGLAAAKQAIQELGSRLDLERVERRSYLELFLENLV